MPETPQASASVESKPAEQSRLTVDPPRKRSPSPDILNLIPGTENGSASTLGDGWGNEASNDRQSTMSGPEDRQVQSDRQELEEKTQQAAFSAWHRQPSSSAAQAPVQAVRPGPPVASVSSAPLVEMQSRVVSTMPPTMAAAQPLGGAAHPQMMMQAKPGPHQPAMFVRPQSMHMAGMAPGVPLGTHVVINPGAPQVKPQQLMPQQVPASQASQPRMQQAPLMGQYLAAGQTNPALSGQQQAAALAAANMSMRPGSPRQQDMAILRQMDMIARTQEMITAVPAGPLTSMGPTLATPVVPQPQQPHMRGVVMQQRPTAFVPYSTRAPGTQPAPMYQAQPRPIPHSYVANAGPAAYPLMPQQQPQAVASVTGVSPVYQIAQVRPGQEAHMPHNAYQQYSQAQAAGARRTNGRRNSPRSTRAARPASPRMSSRLPSGSTAPSSAADSATDMGGAQSSEPQQSLNTNSMKPPKEASV